MMNQDMVLHTSGSTGDPKPIVLVMAAVSLIYASSRLLTSLEGIPMP